MVQPSASPWASPVVLVPAPVEAFATGIKNLHG